MTDELGPLRRKFSMWGVSDAETREFLDAASFPQGLVEIATNAREIEPGIALPVDDRGDRELAEVFAWRAGLEDDEYRDQWRSADVHWRFALSPVGREAFARFLLKLPAPIPLERRFIFDVASLAPQLAKLQRRGAAFWLMPQSVLEREQQRGRPGSLYDVISFCLLVALVGEPLVGLQRALSHVGFQSTGTAAQPGLNRAQRRAQARQRPR